MEPTYMKQSKKHAITIQDVAKAAGVSVSTVSRVLNERVDVAQDTQERILSVIGELGYTSNLAARSMRSRHTNLIGLIIPDIGHPYSLEIMKGVNRAIAESEYSLMVYTTGDVQKHSTADHEQHYVSLLNNSITDGVIVVAPVASQFVSDAPIVSVDPHKQKRGYPSVHATNYQGARDAIQYLIGLGHTRIGFIAGRPELESAERRLRGYRDVLTEAGIGIDEDLIVQGDFTLKVGAQCAHKLFELPNPPTAIFAGNDQAALGVYEAAAEKGLRIPEDFSLIGFDNIPEAKYLGLTTVDQFLSEMGFIATKMLIRMIHDEELEEETIQIPTELLVRNSCKSLVSLVV
ncbi:MAG: LacI family transcriptional regulator [Chloroflexi bacterium HGW-Chloroflexi-10]|nr:MAG: LacI family transcriptional regulator [Chloroflexi bacterium HGW-Chloroflexi-10]